jgi:hypothetical protein
MSIVKKAVEYNFAVVEIRDTHLRTREKLGKALLLTLPHVGQMNEPRSKALV